MIDSTKSPEVAWKRYGKLVALAALIIVAAFLIWTKELHHSGSSLPPPAATTPAVPSGNEVSAHTQSPPTTAGLSASARNPFN